MQPQESSAIATPAAAISETWSGQSRVTDANGAKTSKGPALAFYKGKLYMVYRSDDSSGEILYCTFDGSRWSAQINLSDQNQALTSQGPALAVFNNKLYLAFRGKSSSTIRYCSFDGTAWSAQASLTDVNGAKTANGPALATYNGRLFMAYRGDPSSDGKDKSLRSCSFDGSSWSEQTNISTLNGAQTIDSPALAVYDDKLYAVYRGDGGETIWSCFFDGTTWFGQSEITREGEVNDHGPQTSRPVGLATFKNNLLMVYRGKDAPNIWADSFDGSRWAGQANITEQNHAETSANVGLAVLNSTLYAVYRGKDAGNIYSCYLP
jgi:hypothetical protein